MTYDGICRRHFAIFHQFDPSGKGKGEDNDGIAIPQETRVQHGTIFLEENYMPYMYVPIICDLLIQIDAY